MSSPRVGVYLRTTILTTRYDAYEVELLDFCEKQGWDTLQFYRDRVGGSIDQGGFDALERGLKEGKFDADLIGDLFKQQDVDEQHNRDALRRLISDAMGGKLDIVLVHDFGQLGSDKMEVFRVIGQFLGSRAELMIPSIGKVTESTPVPPASKIDFV